MDGPGAWGWAAIFVRGFIRWTIDIVLFIFLLVMLLVARLLGLEWGEP